MPHGIKSKSYDIKGKEITMIEYEGKPWVTWSSLRDLLGFPSAASLPVIEQNMDRGFGSSVTKTKIPKPQNSACVGWILNSDAAIKLVKYRLDDGVNEMTESLFGCFQLFDQEELSPSGESETEISDNTHSPQVNSQEEVEGSPEQEDLTLQKLVDKMEESMNALAQVMKYNFNRINDRVDELEAELMDVKLLARSLREATGSQVQAETIAKLVDMVKDSLVQS